jgi:hypothetical protein
MVAKTTDITRDWAAAQDMDTLRSHVVFLIDSDEELVATVRAVAIIAHEVQQREAGCFNELMDQMIALAASARILKDGDYARSILKIAARHTPEKAVA